MIRDLRRSDAAGLFDLMRLGFPDEERLAGTTPEALERIVRRVLRWDTRLVLGFLRLFGQTIFRYLVVDVDGRMVATTLLTFPERAGFVSNVMVHPEFRRRGYAQALLERARQLAANQRRRYMALEVNQTNAPAIALYERIGYRRLGPGAVTVNREASTPISGGTSPAVRPFVPKDARALVEIARSTVPPEVLEVLPPQESSFRGSGFIDRALESHTQAWVVDRGHGAEAHVAATLSGAATSAHISGPVIGTSVPEDAVAALVRAAIEWTERTHPPRILGRVAGWNERGRAALSGAGFRDVVANWTLFRPVA